VAQQLDRHDFRAGPRPNFRSIYLRQKPWIRRSQDRQPIAADFSVSAFLRDRA